ncbi:MAG: hypothetical protein ACRDKV_02430, partial [Solirubrobacterales bacterium]
MDVNKLSQGEKIAAGSAIILFIVMFFSWFGAPEEVEALAGAVGVDTSANAWQSFDFIDLVLLATVVVAVGAAIAKAADTRVDFPLSTIVTVLGALSTILVLYRILDPPSEASRKFGVFLGVIFAAALTYGGWLAMQEEGTTFEDAADRFRGDDVGGPGPGAGGPGTGGGAEPPSAP